MISSSWKTAFLVLYSSLFLLVRSRFDVSTKDLKAFLTTLSRTHHFKLYSLSFLFYNNYINLCLYIVVYIICLLFVIFLYKKSESSLIAGTNSVHYYTPSTLIPCQECSVFCCILISVCSREKLQCIFASHFFKIIVWDWIIVNNLDYEKTTKTGLVTKVTKTRFVSFDRLVSRLKC